MAAKTSLKSSTRVAKSRLLDCSEPKNTETVLYSGLGDSTVPKPILGHGRSLKQAVGELQPRGSRYDAYRFNFSFLLF